MEKTMLTYKTLDRFEAEYKTEQYTKAQIEAIEMAAYIANMNQSAHRDWTGDDIFADFLRILDIDHIETVPARTAEGITAALERAMQTLEQRKDRSAWSRGVTAYAVDMLQQTTDYYNDGYISADDLATWTTAEAAALSGARDWSEYSWGGCALVYDGDIAAALCTPSELKKTRNGDRRPNSREEWLDVQARALNQAFARVYSAIRAARQEVQQ
jgi:hypothetical protein